MISLNKNFKNYLSVIVQSLTYFVGSILLTILTAPIIYVVFQFPNQVSDLTRIATSKIMASFMAVWNFLVNPMSNKFQIDGFSISESAVSHFSDVKRVFFYCLLGFIILLVVNFGLTKYRKTDLKYTEMVIWKRVILVYLCIFIGILLNFETAFIKFHELVFRNDNWMFDPTIDSIIDIYPETYFALETVVIIFFFSGFVVWRLYQLKKRSGH